MSRSRIVVSAGRFDSPPLSLRAAVAEYVKRTDTIALTEVQRDTRVEVLRRFPLFDVCHIEGGDGRDECALLSRRTKWITDDVLVVQLSETGLPTRSGQHCWALVVKRRLRWRPKVKVIDVVVHLPAHHDIAAQRRAWNESMRKLGVLARFWISRDYRVRISGDFNKDWKVADNRLDMAVLLRPLDCCWMGHTPTKGTHEGRVIDHSWSDMDCEDAWLLRDDDSSDHRPLKARHTL